MATKTIVLPCGGSSADFVDCSGSAIAPATALAKCTDIQALQAAISSMQVQIANLNAIINGLLANTDVLVDCNGNPVATVYVKP